MVARLGRTRTLIGICAAGALVALVSAGIVLAQVQRPAQEQGALGGGGGRRVGPLGGGRGPMGPGAGQAMRGGGAMALGLAFGQLGVTAEQRQAIRKIVESHRTEVQALQEQAVPVRQALRSATWANDEAAIRDASAKLSAIMADQAVLQARIRAEAFDVLTPEQQEKARKLQTDAEQRAGQRMNRLRQARKQQITLL